MLCMILCVSYCCLILDVVLVVYGVAVVMCARIALISPPENDSFQKDLCFTRDVLLQREISEMRGAAGVKFCTMVSTRLYFIMPVRNFGGHTPKRFRGPKTCKI